MNQIDIKRRQIEMCSRVLGLVILMIFGGLVGDNGVVYLAVAMDAFLFFWTLTGSGVADILGRMLRGRNSKGQYRNAAKLRRTAMLLESMVGLAGSVLMFLLAVPVAQKLFRIPYSTALIIILSPTIFLRTISSVMLGYFQGEGTELPTVISSVLRQIGILFFGLLFRKMFQEYGEKVSTLLKQENYTAMYGDMGIALGISVTELVLLLFLLLLYRGSRNKVLKNGEGMRITDSSGSQVRGLYNSLFPTIIAGVLRMLPLLLGLVFYQKVYGSEASVEKYGIFYGRYMVLVCMVILPTYAVLLGSCFKVAAGLRRGDRRDARDYFEGGLHMGVVLSCFWLMAASVLAPQLGAVFGKNNPQLLEEMLHLGSVLILFAVLGGYFTELLRQMRGKYLVLGILAVYDIVFTVGVTVMLNGGKYDILALVYAGILAEGIYMALAGVFVCYQIRCGIDWLQGIVIPAAAASVAGLCILFLGKAITPHLGNQTTVIVCIAAAALVYWGILVFLRNFRGRDMTYLPGGDLVRKIRQLLETR